MNTRPDPRDAFVSLARRCAAESNSDGVLDLLVNEAVIMVDGDDGGIAHWDDERGELR